MEWIDRKINPLHDYAIIFHATRRNRVDFWFFDNYIMPPLSYQLSQIQEV
jgi:hypothetical protein